MYGNGHSPFRRRLHIPITRLRTDRYDPERHEHALLGGLQTLPYSSLECLGLCNDVVRRHDQKYRLRVLFQCKKRG